MITTLLAAALLAAQGAAPPQITTSKRYQVTWAEGLSGLAAQLLVWAEAHHDGIYGPLGQEAAGPTQITLCHDGAAMRARALAEQGSSPPEWAAGLAYPQARAIYLHAADPSDLEETLRHELSHVAFGQIDPRRRAPRWFAEGLAIRQSEAFSFERVWLLTEAASMQALHPLAELRRGFPEGAPRTSVAYAQAVHFVGWLQGIDDGRPFAALLRRLADDTDVTFEVALAESFATPLEALEARWLSSLRVWWGWLPVLLGSSGLWLIAALLLLLAWGRRRAQGRARMREMAAEEAAHDAPRSPPRSLPPPERFIDPYGGRPPTLH
ncbi:hypothetical protein KKB55_22290 [Myxococcota bacterium]|nr:hypothetical protein [Myxococcota bacterium]MBU1900483.1 hypothetical protein [Myxococcota bacterium]